MRRTSNASPGEDQQQQQQEEEEEEEEELEPQSFKPQERYHLLQEIGKGNFGCVYKGIDTHSRFASHLFSFFSAISAAAAAALPPLIRFFLIPPPLL
jgi:serine/threonine protein kinase